MELEYNLNIKDIVNFNIFHINNSSFIKKKIFLARFVIALFYIIVGIVLSYLEKSFMSIIVFSVLSILWIVFYKKYYVRHTKKNVLKMLQEDTNKGIIGNQKIIIEKDKIIEINQSSKIEHYKRCLNRIQNDEKYYYLYLTSITALIIPIIAFEDKKIESDFVNMFKTFLE